MAYTAKAAVCSEILIKHSTQSEHHVEILMLHLEVRKETSRLQQVKDYNYTSTPPLDLLGLF
jgi:hypothetical protein